MPLLPLVNDIPQRASEEHGKQPGDVYGYFNKQMRHLVQKNGGDHYVNWSMFECTEQTAPHPVNTKTYLRLTSENLHVMEFDKSFISAVVDVSIQLAAAAPFDLAHDTSGILELFIGLKNAAEFFHKLDAVCNNMMLRNTQDDAIQEQFAYNTIKGRS